MAKQSCYTVIAVDTESTRTAAWTGNPCTAQLFRQNYAGVPAEWTIIMRISVEPYGILPNGEEVLLYNLENNNGMRVCVLNYGGIVHCLEVPDRRGEIADVVLGHADLGDYLCNDGYLGVVVGRNSNRIADGAFQLGETAYTLEQNSGGNNLHSGSGGLSFRLFSSEAHTFNNLPVLLLHCKLPHLDDGFPGNLDIHIIYALTDDNALMIDYRVVSDADTIINLTNHSYFNLAGHDSGTIYGHVLELDAGFYTPSGATGIPTGEILQVTGTPLDFTHPKPIGEDIGSSYPQLRQYGGYDHNYVLNGGNYRNIATVTEPASGRVMKVFTDLPGVQFYTANSLNTSGKNGAAYTKHHGFCLETQFFPNAVNLPWFPSPVFSAGEEFASTTTYQFSVL